MFIVRDGDGYEVESPDLGGARLAQRCLQAEGHPYPLTILPDGNEPIGDYGTIGQKQGPERHLPLRVIR